ncbi:MFS transporter [Nocardioides sp.]|uniref:MFS transporter n=1 Tax=Nocardioides sp. TaxID=35761 RepID=UPI0027326A5C|nr:MFS transporter [Nocardioides sp.]MDP3892047.1 MFS transporter [Nocardioides sp.]
MAQVPAATPFPPPGFGRLWTGRAASGFGDHVTLLALQTLVVLTLEGTAQQVGWMSSARWLPYLVLGLLVGALVDRRRRKPLMVTTDLVRALLLTAIPAAWVMDALTLPLLLALVASFGTASLINDAASLSFLPRLVPGEHLQRAHARIDGADAVAQTSGPALAGLLIKLLGAPFAVLANAGAYLVAALTVATLSTEEPTHSTRAPAPHLRREIGEGVKGVYGRSGLATLAVSTHVWFVANATLGVVIAPFALLDLRLSPFQFGVATGLAGTGALLGAALATTIGRATGTGGAIIVSHAASSCGVLVMVLAGVGTSGWAAAGVLGAGLACHGWGMGLSNSHEMSFRQRLTPDSMQARVNTTMRSFNRAVVVVVAPLAGLAADRVGMRPALFFAAAVFALALGILAALPLRPPGWSDRD